MLAQSLMAGRGFTYHEPMFGNFVVHALRAPGYPVFLALGNLLGGTDTVIVMQGAVNGLSAALLGALAVRLWSPWRGGSRSWCVSCGRTAGSTRRRS